MSAETLQQYKERIARSGGHGRAASLTKKQRQDSAKKAAEARWAKQKQELDSALNKIEKLKHANARAQSKALRDNAHKLLTQARKRQGEIARNRSL
jgi:hypothetical protein